MIQYKSKLITTAAIIGGVLLVISLSYVKGRWDGSSLVEARVALEKVEWERQVIQAQLEYINEVDKIHETYNVALDQYKQQVEKLAANPKVVTQYVDRYVPVETQCAIPQGFVELHNQAAAGAILNDNPVDAGRVTNKNLNQISRVVAENYYKYNELAAQLEALQQIILQYQKQQQGLVK